jgi:hypothetical protein
LFSGFEDWGGGGEAVGFEIPLLCIVAHKSDDVCMVLAALKAGWLLSAFF